MLKHRSMLFAFIGVLIFVAGTLIGRAQQRKSDFEIDVSTPTGPITVACIRGCQLQWSNPIDNDLRRSIGVTDTITYSCPGTGCKTRLSGIVVPLQKITN